MRHDQFVVRSYAEKQGDIYVGICIDLNLAVQGDSMVEVRKKLDEQITGYLQDIFNGEDKEHIEDLFPRRAPLRFVARYWVIRVAWKLARTLNSLEEARCKKKAQAFNEFWPALLAAGR